jgi:hypothetical protein
MQKLVEGYTELGCSKWKKGKGLLKPNFERLPGRTRSASTLNTIAAIVIFLGGIPLLSAETPF